ncbi:acyl carrier protein [Candidatus Cyanaurora vandensis]|uniref:acyl carrier protein n=1 Tax=Candidatus Cyanaurora vandensis TaxID=2714958 RepID=UPI00257B7549|nr:acyl carrier protein [Candidatus Cyanaurora vandensis]
MPTVTKIQAQRAIIGIIQDMIQDWDLDLDEPIGANSKLAQDIEFSSIDVIQLIVSIEEYFKQKMGFHELLMNDGRYVDDLSVSELAAFVSTKLDGAQP